MRVASWLAGWVDYVFATVLVASRWLCSPILRGARQGSFQPAYAQLPGTGTADGGSGTNDGIQSGRIVKAAEIAMLTLAFFLGAHLFSGGTPTAAAPNINPLALLPASAPAATTVPITAVQREITVQADAFSAATEAQAPADATTTAAATAEATEEAAVLAPAPAAAAHAAALPAATPAPVATVATSAPQPTPVQPTAAAVAPPPPAAASVPAGRVLSEEEVRGAALAAGWAPELLDQVVKVAWCESSFNSGAEYLGARGLMQMLLNYWFEPYGLDPNQWTDPVTNLTAARHAYDVNFRVSGDGWAAWTCKP